MAIAPKSESELRLAVLQAASKVDVGQLKKASEHVYKRCQKVIEEGGGRFEHLL